MIWCVQEDLKQEDDGCCEENLETEVKIEADDVDDEEKEVVVSSPIPVKKVGKKVSDSLIPFK